MTSSAKKTRSREKLGADDASRWARRLKLGNPFAKSVVRAIANYMNEDGTAWPGVATIAADTDLSEDTVVGRLRWLETIGALAIFKCWIDDNGNRNFEGRGRPTSSEIRFLYDVAKEDIETAAAEASKPKVLRGAAKIAHEAKAATSPRPDGEQNDDQTDDASYRHGRELNEVGTGLAPGQPPPPSPRTEELEPQKDSPLPPKGGDPDRSGNEIQERETAKTESWAKFEAAWQEPILRQSIARGVWWALSETEENLATTAARGYVAWRKGQKKPPNVINAHTFLRERDAWQRYAGLAPPEPPKPKPRISIAVDSDEFKALALCRAIARLAPAKAQGSEIVFTGELPAGAAGLAALVKFNRETGDVDQTDWTLAAKDSKRYVAWCQRVAEWTGWPNDHRYWLDKNNNIVATPQEADRENRSLPKCQDGLMMPPLEWPPPKGTGTGPPKSTSQASDDEIDPPFQNSKTG